MRHRTLAPLTRRDMLLRCANGFGAVALTALVAEEGRRLLGQNAQAFTDDQSQKGITTPLKQAEQVIAANAHTYAANYTKPDSGTYGLKIINALNQVRQQCGAASWQTAQ